MPSPTTSSSQPFASLLLTKSGKVLVNCAVGSYAQHPTLLVGPLCQLLTAMQGMSNHPSESYLELNGVGIQLLAGHECLVVAVLCEPSDPLAVESARLIGMQTLNVFGKLYRAQAQSLDEEYEAEQRAAAESYTVHSAVKEGGPDQEAATLRAFGPFAQHYLQPLLLSAPPVERWLQPLLKPAASLRAHLLNPTGQDATVLLCTNARADRPLARFAGPHMHIAWADVVSAAQSAVQARAAERSTASDKQNRKPRLHVLAFPELCDGGGGGGHCLHVAVRAVRLLPGGACLAVYFEGPKPAADADHGSSSSTSVSVPDQPIVPHDLRLAINHAAKLIEAAFPTAVTSIPDLGGGGAIADEEEVEQPLGVIPPTTPRRADSPAAVEAEAPATPLNLSIESPRVGEPPLTPVGAAPAARVQPLRRELYMAADDDADAASEK